MSHRPILLCAARACPACRPVKPQVVNGIPVQPGDIPYVGRLVVDIFGEKGRCTVTLLRPKVILTSGELQGH